MSESNRNRPRFCQNCGRRRSRDVIFNGARVPDYLKLPDSRGGARSCLTGLAARTSIEQKRPVKIADLIRL